LLLPNNFLSFFLEIFNIIKLKLFIGKFLQCYIFFFIDLNCIISPCFTFMPLMDSVLTSKTNEFLTFYTDHIWIKSMVETITYLEILTVQVSTRCVQLSKVTHSFLVVCFCYYYIVPTLKIWHLNHYFLWICFYLLHHYAIAIIFFQNKWLILILIIFVTPNIVDCEIHVYRHFIMLTTSLFIIKLFFIIMFTFNNYKIIFYFFKK
jgi:hypothetical protein